VPMVLNHLIMLRYIIYLYPERYGVIARITIRKFGQDKLLREVQYQILGNKLYTWYINCFTILSHHLKQIRVIPTPQLLNKEDLKILGNRLGVSRDIPQSHIYAKQSHQRLSPHIMLALSIYPRYFPLIMAAWLRLLNNFQHL